MKINLGENEKRGSPALVAGETRVELSQNAILYDRALSSEEIIQDYIKSAKYPTLAALYYYELEKQKNEAVKVGTPAVAAAGAPVASKTPHCHMKDVGGI